MELLEEEGYLANGSQEHADVKYECCEFARVYSAVEEEKTANENYNEIKQIGDESHYRLVLAERVHCLAAKGGEKSVCLRKSLDLVFLS